MKSTPQTIVLLGAGFTTRNMGVWALASGAITSAWHAFPKAQIYIFDYHTKPADYQVKHPGGAGVVRLINLRYSKKIWLRNNIARLLLTAFAIRALPSRSLRKRLISRNFWLRILQEADFIGSIAGGDSFSDIYGFGRFIYVTLPQFLVLALGKPLVLLPQTIGPFRNSLAKIIGRSILRHARKVYTRDYESLKTVRRLIGHDFERLQFCYDLGFVLESYIRKKKLPKCFIKRECCSPFIGLNVSGLLYIGGYTRNNMFGMKTDYCKLINSVINHFIRKHNAQIVLVPHVYGKDENSESDLTACRIIYDNIDHSISSYLHVIDGDYDHHELKAIIGQCDFFLGARMHACIAALSQCVPAIGLAYSRKFRGVYESIDIAELVVDLRDNYADRSLELIKNAYQKRIEFREKLKVVMPAVRESVLNLFAQFY